MSTPLNQPEDILNALDAGPGTPVRRELAKAGDEARLALRCDMLLRSAATAKPESDDELVARIFAGVEQSEADLPQIAAKPAGKLLRWGGPMGSLLALAAVLLIVVFNPGTRAIKFSEPVVASLSVRGDNPPAAVYAEAELHAIATAFEARVSAAAGKVSAKVVATIHVREGLQGALEIGCHVNGQPVLEPRVFTTAEGFQNEADAYARAVAEALTRAGKTP
jgi:hypothetical protein